MLAVKFETAASLRIQRARTSLILDHPFFGSLLFRLKGRESRSIKTMATDGVSLYYNPEFVETLNAATLAGTLAHEVMHPALHHHVRRSGRDPKRWNEACDYAINPLLMDAGLSLPEGVLLDGRFRGMSAEQIYNLLETEAAQDDASEDGENQSSQAESKDESSPAGQADEPSAPDSEGESARSSMPHLPTTKGPQPSKSRREIGMSLSTRPRRLPDRQAKLLPASKGPLKGRRRPRSTGANCYAGIGLTPFRSTIAGCAPTVGFSGQASICPE